ncbi:DUF4190 domain-containing protein [Glycomyces sp. A-F 0318]|uniref:DUF4190 domain-containing protein n=1 Tax=Glycomyces amatae TaxID=2881355 RepID=UPI001E6487DF|nr:DUF4190 domain-containing protein [Glycomyces amatae]MCD0446777.1 DUF4190 domain-containing protein [Glycomyces amatae]
MSYPPAPAPAPEPMPAKQGNAFGVTALVLGLVGLIVFSWIPGINLITGLPLGVLAVIFGIVAMVKAGSRGGKGKGTGLAGIILGVLTLIASIAIYFVLLGIAEDQCNDPDSAVYGSTECADLENM